MAASIKAEKPIFGLVEGWQRDIPIEQDCYQWQDGAWARPGTQSRPSSTPQVYSVLSWNIDFRRSFTSERMLDALKYLQTYLARISHPTIVMLVENLESDLEILKEQEWVRNGYQLTDISSDHWEHGYGTCILIPTTIKTLRVFRVHYSATRMGRDALFVDIDVGGTPLRICSTHLESLVANPPRRPLQLAVAAKYMHEAPASILGGDLNAIEPFDKKLHADNKLNDAYLECGGIEDAESGMTWGQMVPEAEKKFGLSRMDKLLYCGQVVLQNFELFGHDVQLSDDSDVSKTLRARDGLDKAWVTDHLGVKADFKIDTPRSTSTMSQSSLRSSEKL